MEVRQAVTYADFFQLATVFLDEQFDFLVTAFVLVLPYSLKINYNLIGFNNILAFKSEMISETDSRLPRV